MIDVGLTITIIGAVVGWIATIAGVFVALRRMAGGDKDSVFDRMDRLNKALEIRIECLERSEEKLQEIIKLKDNQISELERKIDLLMIENVELRRKISVLLKNDR